LLRNGVSPRPWVCAAPGVGLGAAVTARLVIDTRREGPAPAICDVPWTSPCCSASASPREGDPAWRPTYEHLFFLRCLFSFPKAPHSSNNLERCLGMPNNKTHFRCGFIINVRIVYLSWKDYSD